MEIEKIINELENENVRHLPRYVIYEYISEVEYTILEENLDKEKLFYALYLLSFNPFGKSKVIEILNYLQ